MAFLELNYRDNLFARVPIKNVLVDRLIKKRENVLFVGEGDFTFTVAFAALRQHCNPAAQEDVWKGIISSRYEDIPKERLPKVKIWCKEFCLTPEHASEIDKLPRVPVEWVWEYGVDACNIPRGLVTPVSVVWFQCPWGDDIPGLMAGFLINTASKLRRGGYVCVGITKHTDYTSRYELEEILGEDLRYNRYRTHPDIWHQYSFLGADEELVKWVLDYGYHHGTCTDRDIHDYIKDDHITLVFKRK